MAKYNSIEAAVALAEAQTGVATGSRIRLVEKRQKRARYWTKGEEEFLRKNYGWLSETQIGRQLGRTQSAIENHAKRELDLTPPSKASNVLTGEHVAMGLCIDGKSVHMLCDRGILPFRRQAGSRALPGHERVIRLIDRMVLMRWILNPLNWCYFKPERVGRMIRRGNRAYTNVYDQEFWEQAAKVLRRARRNWKDKWLNPIQAGRILGLVGSASDHNINRAIHRGTLKATRWGNWKILRGNLPKTGTIDATGKWVPRIISHQELGKKNSRKFWADCYAGRRAWPNIGGHNKKVNERTKFFKLLPIKKNVFQISRILGISNQTAYKWLKEKYGLKWPEKFSWTRPARRARFLEVFKKTGSVKKAAASAKINIESSYRWLYEEWGKGWKKRRKK